MSKNKITLDPRNYRVRGQESKDLIRKSLEENGAGRSVLMDKDGVMIAGNGVYEQSLELGIPIKVIKTKGDQLIVIQREDLSTEDERRRNLALADNSIALLADWDEEMIKEDFDEDAAADWGAYIDFGEMDYDFDKSTMGEDTQTYANAAIRQIVLYYGIDKHKSVLERLSEVIAHYGLKDNSEAMEKLLDLYESSRGN